LSDCEHFSNRVAPGMEIQFEEKSFFWHRRDALGVWRLAFGVLASDVRAAFPLSLVNDEILPRQSAGCLLSCLPG
jgi:hypothetical protein